MNDGEYFEPDDEYQPRYKPLSEIDPSAISQSLRSLTLLGDDPYLCMQTMNLTAVDPFIGGLETHLLRTWIEEESTPVSDALFVSAQSQMWIFAAYELLRTWKQRTSDMIKWYENGGLELKLRSLKASDGYKHFGREHRANQIKKVIDDPSLISRIRDDNKRVHVLFAQLEAIRVSLAKHEVRGKGGSVALAPGYGRINRWCGALDYELENGEYSIGYINRRDIADSIRGLLAIDEIPSDEELNSFDEFMRGTKLHPSS